jgi:hypothetical protein
LEKPFLFGALQFFAHIRIGPQEEGGAVDIVEKVSVNETFKI